MYKIKCTYKTYDKYCSLFDQMQYRADDYAPTKSELQYIVLPNIQEYILFLLWIDDTGYETEENKESRKMIEKIINEHLMLVEDEQ